MTEILIGFYCPIQEKMSGSFIYSTENGQKAIVTEVCRKSQVRGNVRLAKLQCVGEVTKILEVYHSPKIFNYINEDLYNCKLNNKFK